MNTILITEDEKFIRKGLVTMVRRSGIPVETVLEARDGEEALELLRQNQVDLLVTDIRMPKMDGIELVSRLGELGHRPMVLVVSGYDDFSYAVEMLRGGAFDYLLKPVERERLFEALEKLEGQYRQEQARQEEEDQRFLRALRQLMLEQDPDSPEWREQIQQCRNGFFPGPYVGFCAGDCSYPLPEGTLRLHAVGTFFFYAVPQESAEKLAVLLPAPVGRSGICTGPESLHLCYQEARRAWQRSFFTGEPCGELPPQAFRPLSITVEQLMGLAGLSRGQEIVQFLNGEGVRTARGEADPGGGRPAVRPVRPAAGERLQPVHGRGGGTPALCRPMGLSRLEGVPGRPGSVAGQILRQDGPGVRRLREQAKDPAGGPVYPAAFPGAPEHDGGIQPCVHELLPVQPAV